MIEMVDDPGDADDDIFGKKVDALAVKTRNFDGRLLVLENKLLQPQHDSYSYYKKQGNHYYEQHPQGYEDYYEQHPQGYEDYYEHYPQGDEDDEDDYEDYYEHPQPQPQDEDDAYHTPFHLRLQENPNVEEPILQAHFHLSYLPGWPVEELHQKADKSRSFPAKGIYQAIHTNRKQYEVDFKAMKYPKPEKLHNLEELGPKLGKYITKYARPLDEGTKDAYMLAEHEWWKHSVYFENITKFQYFNQIRKFHKRYGSENSPQFIGRLLSHTTQEILPGTTRTAREISDALFEAYKVRVAVGSETDDNDFHRFTYVHFGIDKYGELCDESLLYTNGLRDNDQVIIVKEYDSTRRKFRFA